MKTREGIQVVTHKRSYMGYDFGSLEDSVAQKLDLENVCLQPSETSGRKRRSAPSD